MQNLPYYNPYDCFVTEMPIGVKPSPPKLLAPHAYNVPGVAAANVVAKPTPNILVQKLKDPTCTGLDVK